MDFYKNAIENIYSKTNFIEQTLGTIKGRAMSMVNGKLGDIENGISHITTVATDLKNTLPAIIN